MNAIVFLLLILGLALLFLSWRLRQESGLPAGDVTYSDADAVAQPLVSQRYGLVGKPDYIVLHDGVPIPVEVKPNRTADEPYESDVLQVAAYCLLIEETNAKTPPFGVLRYRDATHQIDYTPLLRGRLLRTLEDMRAALDADDVARSHQSAARCEACGFRGSCEECLV